jgi:hypothetical protein
MGAPNRQAFSFIYLLILLGGVSVKVLFSLILVDWHLFVPASAHCMGGDCKL